MKIQLRLLSLFMCGLSIASCQRMDGFTDVGMLESFTGMVRVTPGISDDMMSEVVTTGLMTFNSDGHRVIIADAKGEAFSLRDMLLKNANEDELKGFQMILSRINIHPDDQLQFSGFEGNVDPADKKRVIIDGFSASTNGIKTLNVQVEGVAKIDKSNKMYLWSEIYIYILLKDLKKNLPELLDFFTYGEGDQSLDEIEDENTKISIATIKFQGASLTGFI